MSLRKLATVFLGLFVLGSVAFAIYRQSEGAPESNEVGVAAVSEERSSGATIDADAATIIVPEQPAPSRRIVAMYFHGDVRCATCRTVEAYAREAVEQGFPDQVEKGMVSFVAVNVDRPENRHYVTDYNLVARSVVVAEELDGTITRWNSLNDVWTLVGDHDAYITYVRGAVGDLLESV
jgi:hypothetical protein